MNWKDFWLGVACGVFGSYIISITLVGLFPEVFK